LRIHSRTTWRIRCAATDDVPRQEGGVAYSDGIGRMLRYEAADRRLFWERNKLRRLATMAYDNDAHRLD